LISTNFSNSSAKGERETENKREYVPGGNKRQKIAKNQLKKLFIFPMPAQRSLTPTTHHPSTTQPPSSPSPGTGTPGTNGSILVRRMSDKEMEKIEN